MSILSFVISAPSDRATFLDLFSSLQGCGDAGPEGGEEGQGLDGWPAPGGHLEYTTGGGEQPGEQPPAQPPMCVHHSLPINVCWGTIPWH